MKLITVGVVVIVYLVAVYAFAWSQKRRAERLLVRLRAEEPEVWEGLGKPDSVDSAVSDPEQRWHEFVKSGAYRTRCNPELAAALDYWRGLLNWFLVALALTGLLIVYVVWQFTGSGVGEAG